MSLRLEHRAEKVSARPTGMQMQFAHGRLRNWAQMSVTDWGHLGKPGLWSKVLGHPEDIAVG